MSEMKKPVVSVRSSLPVVGSPSVRSVPVVRFEPLLDLHEAAAILGMHWKTLEAKARGTKFPRSRLENAGGSGSVRSISGWSKG